MQVTETLSEGLKHEFQVTVPMAELQAQVNDKLNEMKDRVRINGFRPGKVPVGHLRRVYGRAAMAETGTLSFFNPMSTTALISALPEA